jgi:hypothetical protein
MRPIIAARCFGLTKKGVPIVARPFSWQAHDPPKG